MPSPRHPLSRAISVLVALSLCALGVPAIATPTPAAAANLADVQAQAAAARAKLASMRTSLASGMSAFTSASNDLSKTRAQIAADSRELGRVQASLKSGEKSLNTQAEFLYRTDGAGFVEVLLGASTFDDFAARLSVLQTIASKDAGLVSSLKQDREEQARILTALKQREASQAALVSKVASQRDSVQSAVNQQQAYLASLSSQVQNLVAAQERAAQQAAASSGSGGGGGSVTGPSPSQPSPPAQSGSVSVKLATVTGRSGKWWVMTSMSSTYHPTGVTFSGEASEYSVADNGTGTSSGRPLNDSELTCAHPSLAFGTRLAITHDGHRVIVIVTDRGPYVGGRVVDLSLRAASLLNIDGIGQVKCEIVQPD